MFYAHCFFVLLSLFLLLFFFIFRFINDFLPQIKTVQLNMYTDDDYLHTSNSDLVSLEGCILLGVNSATVSYTHLTLPTICSV